MKFPMFFALVSVTMMALAAFGVGYACGCYTGIGRGRQLAHDLCLEWARLALHGHEKWRALTPATALHRAAELLNPERRS